MTVEIKNRLEDQNKQPVNALLLLLGGSGSRFASKTPKQFIHYNDKQFGRIKVFEASVKRLLSRKNLFQHVVFAVNSAFINDKLFLDSYQNLQNEFLFIQFEATVGGDTRFESFRKAFNRAMLKNIDNIAVHDANRPFLSAQFLNQIEAAMQRLSSEEPCYIPVIPQTDSTCQVQNNKVTAYLHREKLARVQTPQLMHLKSAQQALTNMQDGDFTDEGSFMLKNGFKVKTYEGDETNMKITFPGDL